MDRGFSYLTVLPTAQIMSRAVLDPMALYIEASVARPNETWRAYLLRAEAERLLDPVKKDLPAWTVRTIVPE